MRGKNGKKKSKSHMFTIVNTEIENDRATICSVCIHSKSSHI